jgi:mannose-6-phosphate isomerase-like protein (cupin superfamily)
MERLTWTDFAERNAPFHASRTLVRRNLSCPVHGHHAFVEVFHVVRGKGIHRLNGARKQVSQGYLCCIRATDVHGFSAIDQPGFVICNAAFPQSRVEALGRRYFRGTVPFFDETRQAPYECTNAGGRAAPIFDTLLSAPAALDRYADAFLLSLFAFLEGMPNRCADCDLPQWLDRACTLIDDRSSLSPESRARFAYLSKRAGQDAFTDCQ